MEGPPLTVDEIQKMKVVELRGFLTTRGLDTRGVKAVLVDRLVAAVEKEPKQVKPAVGAAAPATPTVPIPSNNSAILTPPSSAPTVISANDGSSPARSARSLPDSPIKTLPVSPVKVISSPTVVPIQSPTKISGPPVTNPVSSPTKASLSPARDTTSPTKTVTSPVKLDSTPVGTPPPTPVLSASPARAVSPVKPTSPVKSVSPTKVVIGSGPEPVPENIPVKDESQGIEQSAPSQEESNDDASANAKEEKEEPMETDEDNEKLNKRKVEEVNGVSTTPSEANEAPAKKLKTEPPKPKVVEENEPDFEDKGVVLDWYQSDLNLKIDKTDFLKAAPIIFDEFPWAFCGVKATYGFTSGKLCFETKWEENFAGRSTVGKDDVQHRLRIGWSDLHAELQLGEEKFSFGYDSHEGKFYNAGEVEEGGDSFTKDDVVTCYLDLESDPIEFKFAKNGILLEKSMKIPKADVEGKVWFPHILSRNTSFVVNFGTTEPAHPLLEGFQMVDKIEEGETRIRGPQRANSRADCEFVMLCGLACSGKTRWAKEHKSANADKHFLILGTSTVVERIMKMSTAQKTHDILLSKAGRFTERLMELAAARRRNYILDQSNLMPSVQRRKTAGFEGFRRRAVVIIPPEEEFQNRIKAREQEQGKSVPKSTLLDMKAGYRLPEVGDIFSEVEFAGVTKEEAEALVQKYNKEGVAAGFGQKTSGGRGGRGGPFRGGRGGPPFIRGGAPRGGGWRGGVPRGRPPPLAMRGSMGMRGRGAPIAARVSRNPPSRGFAPSRGGPPLRGGRGIPPLAARGGGYAGGSVRRDFQPRGMRDGPPRGGGGAGGGGSWVRGGSSSSPGRPLFPGRGGSAYGSSNGSGGRQYAQNTNVWSSQPGSPFGQQQQSRFGGGRSGSGQGGNFQNQAWGGQTQNWGRNSGGGGGSNQYADPWVQQVPDQGFGQSWDNSRSNMGVNRNSGGGGSWQTYGGQTYNSFSSGGGGYRR